MLMVDTIPRESGQHSTGRWTDDTHRTNRLSEHGDAGYFDLIGILFFSQR